MKIDIKYQWKFALIWGFMINPSNINGNCGTYNRMNVYVTNIGSLEQRKLSFGRTAIHIYWKAGFDLVGSGISLRNVEPPHCSNANHKIHKGCCIKMSSLMARSHWCSIITKAEIAVQQLKWTVATWPKPSKSPKHWIVPQSLETRNHFLFRSNSPVWLCLTHIKISWVWKYPKIPSKIPSALGSRFGSPFSPRHSEALSHTWHEFPSTSHLADGIPRTTKIHGGYQLQLYTRWCPPVIYAL